MKSEQKATSVYFHSFLSSYVIPFSIIEEEPDKKDVSNFIKKLESIKYPLTKKKKYDEYIELSHSDFERAELNKELEKTKLLGYENINKNNKVRIYKEEEKDNIIEFLKDKFNNVKLDKQNIDNKETIICFSDNPNIYKGISIAVNNFGHYKTKKVNINGSEKLHIWKPEPFEEIIEELTKSDLINIEEKILKDENKTAEIKITDMNNEKVKTKLNEVIKTLKDKFPYIKIDNKKDLIVLKEIYQFDYIKDYLKSKDISFDIEKDENKSELLDVWEKITYTQDNTNIDQIRFLLNPIEETLFYNDKFFYYKLNKRVKNVLFNDVDKLSYNKNGR
ncbi:MAG: hypothetical protein ACOCV8_05745 [Spirochaetota bacterium]